MKQRKQGSNASVSVLGVRLPGPGVRLSVRKTVNTIIPTRAHYVNTRNPGTKRPRNQGSRQTKQATRKPRLAWSQVPWPPGSCGYLISTCAPSASSFALTCSASALLTFSFTGLGAPSTRSLASFNPSPVSSRTTLMTWIFLSPMALRMASNSVCSSTAWAAPDGPPAAGAATAIGAAAVTPNFCSSAFTSSASSSTVRLPIASMISSLLNPPPAVFVLVSAIFNYPLLSDLLDPLDLLDLLNLLDLLYLSDFRMQIKYWLLIQWVQ